MTRCLRKRAQDRYPDARELASDLKTVQREVMDAYETAFKRTKLVARYPAGPADPRYADFENKVRFPPR